MPRPQKKRCVHFDPHAVYFKPRGIPLHELNEIILTLEELEALRLKNIEQLNQTKAAHKMRISQSTFQRVLSTGYKKITDALVFGKAIKIQKTKATIHLTDCSK